MASFFESLSKAAHREPSRSKRGRSLNPEAAQPSTAKSADLLKSDEKISLLGQKRIFSTPIGSKNNQKWRRRRGCGCSLALFSENRLPALRQPEEAVAFISVSRVFAPAPGSTLRQPGLRASPRFGVRRRIVYFRFASPAPKPGGFGLRLRAKRRAVGYGANDG